MKRSRAYIVAGVCGCFAVGFVACAAETQCEGAGDCLEGEQCVGGRCRTAAGGNGGAGGGGGAGGAGGASGAGGIGGEGALGGTGGGGGVGATGGTGGTGGSGASGGTGGSGASGGTGGSGCSDPRIGTACTTGVGSCATSGSWICAGDVPACDALPGVARPETCNGLDDDCNGTADDVSGCVSTVAGAGPPAFAIGALADARFGIPFDLLALPDGDVLLADAGNHVILRISPTAGTVVVEAGVPRSCGTEDGPAGVGRMCGPRGLALAADGTVYVADTLNLALRTLVGGVLGRAAGTGAWGDADGPALAATFTRPVRVAALGGTVYVADETACRIRAYDGVDVTTVAGTTCGDLVEGPAQSAVFPAVYGLAADEATGTLYFTDATSRVLALAGGAVSSVAGSDPGFADGVGTAARLARPGQLVLAPAGLYVSDVGNNRVRLVTPAGRVSTVAGTGTYALRDGPATAARLTPPGGLAWLGRDLWLVSPDDARLRRLDTVGGDLETLAGGPPTTLRDGPGAVALLFQPTGLAVDPATGTTYIGDSGNHVIRALDPDGTVRTVAGSGESGYLDGALAAAQFCRPGRLALRADGTLVVADACNQRLRIVDLPAGVVSTLAGSGACSGRDGPALDASFCDPGDVVVAADGSIYVADTGSSTIRVVGGGQVRTLAGVPGVNGTLDGPGASALFNWPKGLALGPDGLLYVADTGNGRIRRVDPATGVVDTFAGTVACGTANGPVATAELCEPVALAFDGPDLFVAAQNEERIRRISRGIVSSVAGRIWWWSFADGPADQALFSGPSALVPSPAGGFLLADSNNNRIRRIVP